MVQGLRNLDEFSTNRSQVVIRHNAIMDKSDLHYRNENVLSNVIVGSTDLLVNFDVKSLFTRFPILDTVTIIEKLLARDGESLDSTDNSVKFLSTYFQSQGMFFQQTN